MDKNLRKFLCALFICAAFFPATPSSGQVVYKNFSQNASNNLLYCEGVLLGRDGGVYGTSRDGGNHNAGMVFRMDPETLAFTVLHSFTTNGNDGQFPVGTQFGGAGYGGGTLIQAQDGFLYGITDLGGTTKGGTVYKVSPSGTGYQVVFSFPTNEAFGPGFSGPIHPSGLIQGLDGALYGTTWHGGNTSLGTVFRLTLDGLGYTQLHTFGLGTNGDTLYASMIQGRDGMLYGSTIFGGTSEVGTLFKIATNGLNFAKIHDFFTTNEFAPGGGCYPAVPLLQAANGALYGTTLRGGTNKCGTVFKINTDGSGYAELHSFENPNGAFDQGRFPGPLVQDNNGSLYGGAYGLGFYKINPDGTGYTEFNDPIPNSNIVPGALVYAMGPDGSLYGLGLKLGFALQNYALIHQFKSDGLDGRVPQSTVVPGPDGTLYGTTIFGGTNQATVFRLNANGSSYTQIHMFLTNGVDGQFPLAMLVGSDGMLYGITPIGGTNKAGTVFKLNTNGSSYSLLHTFVTNGIDGQNAVGLVQNTDTSLYGITQFGGSNNVGTVFKVSVSGTGYTLLRTFLTNGIDGQNVSALVQGSNSMLYGTTFSGGTNQSGAVFKLNNNGTGYALIHTFANNGIDGQTPKGLVQGRDGLLYGVTQTGGSNAVGTVFKLNVNGGAYALLHTFTSTGNDGRMPIHVMQATDGTLYGTTSSGGTFAGTIFKLNTNGSGYSVVHNFDQNLTQSDGFGPAAGLTQGSDGALYGTTTGGGIYNSGTVFRLALNSGNINAFSFLPNKTFQLDVVGAALNFRIDASTNLVNWLTLTNVTNSAGTFHYIDPNATNFRSRFYRVHSSP